MKKMQLERRDVLTNLEHKGFEKKEGKKHTVLIYHNKEGKKTVINTIVSRGTKCKSLGNDLVGTMAKQCGLTTPQFVSLIDCSMSRDDYDHLVKESQ